MSTFQRDFPQNNSGPNSAFILVTDKAPMVSSRGGVVGLLTWPIPLYMGMSVSYHSHLHMWGWVELPEQVCDPTLHSTNPKEHE